MRQPAQDVPLFENPALVRRAARVPEGSQPIPIVFPPNYRKFLHSTVDFRAQVAPIDAEILSELSQLGQPLTQKAFALFCGEGCPTPFYLRVEENVGSIRQSRLNSVVKDWNPPKVGTLLTEWYFEDSKTGLPVPFDDEQLLSWFIPCAKNHILLVENHVLPIRWTGKLYGFEGPLYFYQTGPIGFTMSPEGLFTAKMEVYFNDSYNHDKQLWQDHVTRLQRG